MANCHELPNGTKVKVDEKRYGRVINTTRPLGTFNLFNVFTDDGEKMQVPRHRLRVIPETSSTTSFDRSVDLPAPLPRSPPLPVPKLQLPDDVLQSLLQDDVFAEEGIDDSRPTVSAYGFERIDQFVHENLNKNTQRKTLYDIKNVQAYMARHNDLRPIETIDPNELNKIMCTYFLDLAKKDGKSYETTTLRAMLSSVARYLKGKNYPVSIMDSVAFQQLRSVVQTKQKVAKQEGCGNLPKKAEALSEEDVDALWQANQLGTIDPEVILNTLWWQNTVHFGIRSVKPHRDMKWGDVTLRHDANGEEFLELNERQSKTNQGENPNSVREVTPKAWATHDDRCPVAVYKRYAEVRPAGFSGADDPFYLATNTKIASKEYPWFKRQPVGVNKLSSIMKRMTTQAGLQGARYTNHSARKFLLQTLSKNNVPPTQIMQISGHKNVQSVRNYSHITEDQHKSCSFLLSGRPATQITATPRDRSPLQPLEVTRETVSVIQSRRDAPIFGGTVNAGTINIFNCSCEHGHAH